MQKNCQPWSWWCCTMASTSQLVALPKQGSSRPSLLSQLGGINRSASLLLPCFFRLLPLFLSPSFQFALFSVLFNSIEPIKSSVASVINPFTLGFKLFKGAVLRVYDAVCIFYLSVEFFQDSPKQLVKRFSLDVTTFCNGFI